ncbi:MAG TPA: DUF1501 domain-containing protein [Xanthobacteraceae bacterium]|jgi:uncharacterized protein (DUF1501 family)
MIPNPHAPSRRALLLASGTLFAWAFAPKLARAEGRDPRLLTIVLRGALDGLAAVAPVGDPDWIGLRGDKALALNGATPGLPLNSFFALNPAMPNLHRLYTSGAATIVHACATPYRERSHFDGQDVLESGVLRPGASETGWLNRALATLAPAERAGSASRDAFAVGPMTPLVVRGPAPILSWTPPRLPPANDDTMMRLLDLYRHTDPALARALEERMGLAAIAGAGGTTKPDQKPQSGPAAQVRAYFADSAGMAAKFLAQPDGPRIGALAFDGWDTHADEGPISGKLAALLGALDGALAAIETNMGPAWRDTVAVVVTEFGRTARINGTDGTDHGTATVAFLAGGALKGGRVLADWPGLKPAQLQDGRDLKPTTDLRAVVKGLLHDHLRVDERALVAKVFPDSGAVKPMVGLLA